MTELLNCQGEMRQLAELLRPEPLADGSQPEERIIICDVSWERYLALDRALGADRPGPRFYYLNGDLEIMTTSNEHERIKEWIGGFLEIYFEEVGIEVVPRGQAIFALGSTGKHEPAPTSRLLPGLDTGLVERCAGMRSWGEARKTFRAGLTARSD